MRASEITRILRSTYDLSECIGAYQAPHNFMIRGPSFGIYVANDQAVASIGERVLSVEQLVQLITQISPASLNVRSDGEALVVTVGEVVILISPDPRGYEAANINLSDPFDVLVL